MAEEIKSGLLNAREAAAFLRVGLGTLRDWTAQRKIQYVKLGSRVLFRLEDLKQFVAANLVPAQ